MRIFFIVLILSFSCTVRKRYNKRTSCIESIVAFPGVIISELSERGFSLNNFYSFPNIGEYSKLYWIETKNYEFDEAGFSDLPY